MSEIIPVNTKAIFFDHDDTLVGTYIAKSAQHKYVAKKWYNIELTDEKIRKHWGMPLNELYKIFYETDDVDLAEQHVLECHKEYPKQLLEGTIETLQTLQEMGLKLGVVTSTAKFSFDHDLDVLGIPRALLDYTQTQESTAYHKPDPRVFEPAIRWLGNHSINTSEVLYVGDGLLDREAAIGAGFNFVGVETGLLTRQQFKKAGSLAISSLVELVK
ncbi:MAG TPA: HAD hydrolase-like protein [Patescibacteria group bacterium]|jgi:phosphoglycolate phosphatase-like HAD superfamily hydrolase|nr:HAD hydrolase-like protein [Patescibacteria group bacterium]